MQLKRQSVEAWQYEKHYSKGNNISENPIPKTRNFQTSRPCEVRSSGQVTTFVVCSVFSSELSSCRVTYENCYKSSFFLEAFLEILIRSGKMRHVELNSGTSKSSK